MHKLATLQSKRCNNSVNNVIYSPKFEKVKIKLASTLVIVVKDQRSYVDRISKNRKYSRVRWNRNTLTHIPVYLF